MRQFPIFLNLQGRTALILGDGEVADRKAEPLRQAGANLRFATRFDPSDLSGCTLAIGTDAPETELRALSAAAQAAAIPVNIVDRPELCSFIMPAIVDRDPITIAISTAGAAPVLARLLRLRIEAVVPPAFGRLATLAGSFKADLRRRLPDVTQRRRLLDQLLTGTVADLVFAGRDDEARAAFAAALDGVAPSPGIVHLVAAGPGPADLLTLRALRLLGEADVIVHTRDVSPGVLGMARREAQRIATDGNEDDPAALLIRLAQGGGKVVWLTPAATGPTEALSAAGVAWDRAPGVVPPAPDWLTGRTFTKA